MSKAWGDTKSWVSEHKVVIAQVATEVVVGGLCVGTATGAGFATGGVGFAAAAGCGAVAGAASSAVGNMLSDDADHSISGQLSDMGEGAIWGAASGAVGYGLGKVGAKILAKCHSFLPGTGVLLADGTRKAIEDVEVGDVVITTDPETGETTEKPVVETITTEDDKDFTEISIAVDGAYSSIVATDPHPFWVPELKKWVQASDLQLGQTLRTSAGTRVQITALSHYTKHQRTHDLTIEDIHAYYVLAGATPVLVHNCGEAADDLLDFADEALNMSPESRPNVATKITSADGEHVRFAYAMDTRSGTMPPQTARAVANSGHHGGCGEVGCVIQFENAEIPLEGSTFQSVMIGGGGRGNSFPIENHGELIAPCLACQRFLPLIGGRG